MKSYFPFTDYDFWAYISCGFVFLFALNHVLPDRDLSAVHLDARRGSDRRRGSVRRRPPSCGPLVGASRTHAEATQHVDEPIERLPFE